MAIGADSTYPDLMDKHKQSALSNNLNYRHKMSQYAQRASVAFHTQVNTYEHTGLISMNLYTALNHHVASQPNQIFTDFTAD